MEISWEMNPPPPSIELLGAFSTSVSVNFPNIQIFTTLSNLYSLNEIVLPLLNFFPDMLRRCEGAVYVHINANLGVLVQRQPKANNIWIYNMLA